MNDSNTHDGCHEMTDYNVPGCNENGGLNYNVIHGGGSGAHYDETIRDDFSHDSSDRCYVVVLWHQTAMQ